ncbi:hypothetical protein [Methanolapillus millepedarum]|uniref:hypothetical protein n=1 Tax=Methanolapillus millepedarum TaxID=3028296 RepID=UPI0030B8B7EC
MKIENGLFFSPAMLPEWKQPKQLLVKTIIIKTVAGQNSLNPPYFWRIDIFLAYLFKNIF